MNRTIHETEITETTLLTLEVINTNSKKGITETTLLTLKVNVD